MRQAYRVNSKKANWPKFISSYLSVLSQRQSQLLLPITIITILPCSFGTSWITIQKKNYFTYGKKFKTLTGIKLPLRPHLSNNSKN